MRSPLQVALAIFIVLPMCFVWAYAILNAEPLP